VRFDNCLTILIQKPEDTETDTKIEQLQSGYFDVIDGFTMSINRVYYWYNEQLYKRGINFSSEYYDCYLKKMIDVGWNFDGPVFSVEKNEGKVFYSDIPLNRGKKMIYEDGTFYANIFAN